MKLLLFIFFSPSWFTIIQPLALKLKCVLKLEYGLAKSEIGGDPLQVPSNSSFHCCRAGCRDSLGSCWSLFWMVIFLLLASFVQWVAFEGRKAEGSLCLPCTEAANTWHMSTGNNSCTRDGCLPWVAFQEQGDFGKKKCCCARLPSCTCCYQKLPLWILFLQSWSQVLLQSITRGVSCWLLQETCLRVAWNGS